MRNGGPGWKGYYLSAYGLAVKHGFQGTEEEWLKFLKAEVEMIYENGEFGWRNKGEEEWHWIPEFQQLLTDLEKHGEAAVSAAQTANQAAQAAGIATEQAETAAAQADRAATGAQTATTNADASAANADEKAGQAERAVQNATEKAQAAEAAANSANTAAQAAQEKANAADTAAQGANAAKAAAETAAASASQQAQAASEAAQAANASSEAADTAAANANAAKEHAQTQGDYAKEQGNRAKTLSDKLEETDIGGLAADVLALQTFKADLVKGKVPEAQLPYLGGKKVTRFVVGAASAGWTADQVDYLCSGGEDNAQIQLAVQALPDTGGEILLLDGTYNILAPVPIPKPNVAIRGSGPATILKRVANTAQPENGVLWFTGEDGRAENLSVEGSDDTADVGIRVDAAAAGTVIQSVKFNGTKTGVSMEGTQAIVDRCLFFTTKQGVCVKGAGNQVTNNTIGNSTSCGIYLDSSEKALCQGNLIASGRGTGIYCIGDTKSLIIGNQINRSIYLNASEHAWICGNISHSGVVMDEETCNCAVVENLFEGSTKGYIQIADANNCMIQGNMCHLSPSGTGGVYEDGQYTIKITAGTGNLIAWNRLYGKNVICTVEGNIVQNNTVVS